MTFKNQVKEGKRVIVGHDRVAGCTALLSPLQLTGHCVGSHNDRGREQNLLVLGLQAWRALGGD